ncbi:MAG: FtsH protease activity modulator HflK [Immundisolibacterales bacterium]|nr:FtsH protease activity modulator HflK [Immundisolibacterales bacterium]
MAWNQPDGNGGGRDRDPWGNRGGKQSGPPDLDELLGNLQRRLQGLFRGGGSGSGGGRTGGGGGGGKGLRSLGTRGLGIIVALVVVGWGLAGIYIVEPAEEGVVLRFGRYLETTGSGPHWVPYLIDTVEKVNVEEIRRAEIGYRSDGGERPVPPESLMLTRDENIVDVQFAVHYRIKDARNYRFRVRDPDLTLRQATESAIREVVGRNIMDFVLTDGRAVVAEQVRELTQDILDRYETGLLVTSVNMQRAQPPNQVRDAFSDAVKAREDEERYKNEARAYAAEILPRARGEANAMLERSEGYKQRVINEAQGDASRFTSVLTEYSKSPEVTRQRLYIDAMEDVLSNSTKVLLDVEGGNNLLYVPLDKLLTGVTGDRSADDSASSFDSSGSGTGGTSSGQTARSRGRSRQ